MSDLDKLMNKLKQGDEKVEEVKEEPQEDQAKDEFEDEFEDDLEVEETPKQEEKVEDVKPQEENQQHSVDSEVALLQNNGVFHRELLLTLKELVDVHKVNTQVLLDIKKKLYGEDGKKSE